MTNINTRTISLAAAQDTERVLDTNLTATQYHLAAEVDAAIMARGLEGRAAVGSARIHSFKTYDYSDRNYNLFGGRSV